MNSEASTTIPGTVEKIITPVDPKEPEKAQIEVETDEHLYRELRIENELTDKEGNPVRLKVGAKVAVTIEAPPEAVVPDKP